MIKIDLYKNARGQIGSYRVCGHAGDGPAGQSIVCAWVSAVTQMTLIGLEEELHCPLRYQTEEDEGLLEVSLKGEPDEKTQVLTGSMEMVLQQLQEQYPEHVQLNEHRR